jgi:glycosyltransferase involved in cell wall biosynthesis
MDIVTIGIASVFLLTFLWQIRFFAWFIRLGMYREVADNKDTPGVSVVIAARNEYHHLKKFLPDILKQKYPEYEVIVVNNYSDDESEDYLHELSNQYTHLKVINLQQQLNFFRGKKFPLSIGIKSASYDYILLTDADCRPASENWISGMMRCYDTETEFVLGAGPYEKKPGLLNLLIQYETFKTALMYFSLALAGKPYMGVGRNLSYRKETFYRSGGFVSHYQVASGDDDLFVNKNAHAQNTRICPDPETFMISAAKSSWQLWFRQKKRHLSTGKYYKKKDKILLGSYSLSRVFLYVSFLLGLFLLPIGQWYYMLLAGMLFFVMLQIITFELAAKKLHYKNLGFLAPVLEVFFVLSEPVWFVSGIFKRQQTWK